jgi:vault protein inter-alpha-trypsin-like protein
MSRTAFVFVLIVLAAVGLAAGLAVDSAKPGSSQPAAAAARFAPASFRFTPETDEPAAEPGAPIRLTASDGTGLSLVALEANGILEPPLAFTEMHLTFENPRDQVIEGRFRIALPAGAALSRFAMRIGDFWQEGEVVERQRARVAYEDSLHRRVDPALLEQEAGNEFSARVFPIPARGRKEIIVSYSHAMARADEPYVLPLLGLSEVGQLDVHVLLGEKPAADSAASNLGGEVSDRRVVELHKRSWTPDRDFEIRQDLVAGRAGLRQANLAVVRVAVPLEALPQVPQEITGLYILVDSSASRALGYATQVRRVSELIAGLRGGAGGPTPVGVAAFDQEVAPIFEGPASGFGPAESQRLAARRPLGASDLEGALTWLADRLANGRGRYPRVLLVTDGVATAGDTETRALKAAVHALAARGVERLDVLAVGGLRDEAVLRELATGNLAQDGQRIDGTAPLAEIARRLTLACRSGLKIAVEGAAWVWPDTLDGVQPGDQTLVYADLPATRPLHLTLGGRAVTLGGELVSAERPLLERAWAQARIDRLLHLREAALAGDEDLRRALTIEATELSIKHRVLTPFTALLVLETDFDYARFGLDRKTLADILTVGPGGLTVVNRRLPGRSPELDQWAARPKAIEPEVREQLRSLGDTAQPEAVPEAEGDAAGAATGVVGGVEGGVAGGVPGGSPGGVVSGIVANGREPVQPAEVAAPGVGGKDDALPRVPPPPTPPPLARTEASDAVAETIIVEPRQHRRVRDGEDEKLVAPYSGRFDEVMKSLAAGRIGSARTQAEAWHAEAPGDVLALLALGEAWEAAGDKTAAARAYGSLIDLFPSRADLRRLAGERLERLGDAGLELAIDTYRKAVLDRPDHPSGHRLLAWALLRFGHPEEAFAALEKGLEQQYPGGRFAGVDRVLKDDLGLLAAAWLHAEPARRPEILERLGAHGAHLDGEPSLRFVLSWETDANDVDLHVYDRLGHHAYFEHKTLESGGELYADVTTGYGPECFTVSSPNRGAAPYRLRVHYYSRGPMGYGMGTVQVVRHDGKGGLSVEPRPFVVMADNAMVNLGTVETKSADSMARD